MIVIISDFLVDREPLFRGLDMLRHNRHDILLFHVLDEEELTFPFAGTTRFEGMEEIQEVLCDPRSLREGYIEALQEYLTEVRRGMHTTRHRLSTRAYARVSRRRAVEVPALPRGNAEEREVGVLDSVLWPIGF